uniref:Pectinesterase inhibitor domain-containing protein n=1 Tax=Aegilops tauschii TaxID=37682 RepID=M8CY15_AEGTA
MAMGTSSSILGGALLLVLVLSSAIDVHGGSSSRAAPRSAVDDLCNSLGDHYVTPDMCVSALCIDHSCRSARGLPELAVLATRLTVANATVAQAHIPYSRDVGAVPRLQWAARSVAAGRYSGVSEVLEAACWHVSAECINLAGEVALPKENSEFFFMAYIVQAVVDWVKLSIGH